MKTRMIAILLALALLLGLSGSALATEAQPALELQAGYAMGAVTLRVTALHCQELSSGRFSLVYDQSLELLSATAANAAVSSINTEAPGRVDFAWVGSRPEAEATELLVLVFDAQAAANRLTFAAEASEAFAGQSPLALEAAETLLLVDPFEDLQGHWGRQEALTAYHAGLFAGMSATRFGPDVQLTRAMFVTLLYRMEGSPAVDLSALSYADVGASAYYAPAAIWATEAGISNGTGLGRFSPDQPITRQELLTMLYRYAGLLGEDCSPSADLSVFTDAGAISGWAVDAMAWALERGLVGGYPDGSLRPGATATRAQTAAVLCRFAGLN